MTTSAHLSGADDPPALSPGRWLIATAALLALLAALNLGIAWRMDVFGILRDPRGRALITSEHERKAKYLLNQAYVPENFDALIIGASASVNWHPEYLNGYHFYNESLEGGDASEQRKLVEQALPQGHFKVALVALYPRITGMHLLQDGFDQVKRSEALGSITLYGIEYDAFRDRIEHNPPTFFPNGSHSLPAHPPPAHDNGGPLDPTQDPEAVADYKALVQELMDRGVRIIYVDSPLFGPHYDFNKDVMDTYMASVIKTMPSAPVIDFNAPQYASFRDDATNFIDGVHLSAKGADTLSQMLNERMQQVLNQQ